MITVEEYLARLQERINNPTTKANTRLQELLTPYLSKLNWTNETLEKDMKMFWSVATMRFKTMNEEQFFKRMNWAADKHIHPRAVVKLLLKQ